MEINYCFGCMEPMPEEEVICPHCGHDNSLNHNDESLLHEGAILNGKYLVGHVLGRGGFGVTYLGIDLTLKIRVAIKEYFPNSITSRQLNSKLVKVHNQAVNSERFEKGREAFQREAETLAMFNSPSIAHVREYFRENNTAYIVMDFVDGIGLTQEIKRCGGRIPWQRVVGLMLPLISEMDQLHDKSLTHRDIKPDNIKIVQNEKTGEEHLVLLDFGAARSYASAELTKTYTQILTPGYAPFEQYQARTHLGPFTDIYAVCATMYAAITGEKPAAAPDRIMSEDELRPFSSYGLTDVPEYVEKAIFHGMALNYKDRPQTMAELCRELEGSVQTGPETDPSEQQNNNSAPEPPAGIAQPANISAAETNSWSPAAAAPQEKPAPEPISDTDKTATVQDTGYSRKKSGMRIVLVLAVLLAAAGIFFAIRPKPDRGNNEKTRQIPAVTETTAEETTPMKIGERTATAEIHAGLTETSSALSLTGEAMILWQTEIAETQIAVNATKTEAAKPTDTPTPTLTPLPTDTQTPTAASLPTGTPDPASAYLTLKAGDSFTFGQFEQDNNKNNGSEPIEWEVLAVENSRALLISKYGLDGRQYNEKNDPEVTWETSTLRKWLNEDFLHAAFSSEEQSRIHQVHNSNTDYKGTPHENMGIRSGNVTEDRIFLLAIDEVIKYFPNDESGKCDPTAYATDNGNLVYYYKSAWWLRNPGTTETNKDGALIVSNYSNSYAFSFVEMDISCIVRPAFWLDLSPAPTPTPVPEPLSSRKSLSVGDSFTFGSYEQDEISGADPIEWQVLAVENDHALVISRLILDMKSYTEDHESFKMDDGTVFDDYTTTWEECTLRKWLNNDFYTKAFSSGEQQLILQVTNQNPNNYKYEQDEYGPRGEGGNPTKDRIFLLTADEVLQYIPDKEARMCMTTYFADPEHYKNFFGWWWLRSVGASNSNAACVHVNGAVDDTFTAVNNKAGVRPVFWLDLTNLQEAAETLQPTAVSTPKASGTDLNAGDSFTFGRFEQDNNKNNGAEPIEWWVLTVKKGRALLISKNGLDARKYNETADKTVTWETCSLRKWLNEEFFNTAFSSEEQSRIPLIKNANTDYKGTIYDIGVRGGNVTDDRVFLVSIEEAVEYIRDETFGQGEPTNYAKANGKLDPDYYISWWLRNPGSSETNEIGAAVAGLHGPILGYGFSEMNKTEIVRPAFWLDLAPAPTPTPVPEPLSSKKYLSVGDSFTFGSYEQDETAGADPIEWQVLAVENGRALVISRLILDEKYYNEDYRFINMKVGEIIFDDPSTTWEECTLREWLNNDFYTKAFSSGEQQQILQVTNRNPDNTKYISDEYDTGGEGGNPTKDRIFLLTADEVQQYIPDKEARKCMSTYFAEPEYYNAYNYWWLRSVGKNNACAAVVISSGEVYDSKYSIHGKAGVRPVFWLDLSGLGKAEEPAQPTGTPAAAPEPVLPDVGLKPGGSFTFGRYEQDENAGTDPIEWQVLAVEDGRALLLSKNGLDAGVYNAKREDVSWGNSSIRQWLNDEFFDAAFSSEEKSRIPENSAQGRIFLLSTDEIERYFNTEASRQCQATPYARQNGARANKDSGFSWWWLRSEDRSSSAPSVGSDGKISTSGHYVDTAGVLRPAFWLDL